MGKILPFGLKIAPKTKLFPRRENIETFQNWGERGPIWAVLGPNSWLFDFLSMIRWFIVNAFEKRNETKWKMQQNRNMDG